ncbi:MAG: TetR/AcrR family transcriptional regulator [Actinomycetota bacterium]
MAVSNGARRDEILRVAARVFRNKGYRSATLNDIADEFGFTRAALYYYFKSKEQILVAVIESAGHEITAQLEQTAALDAPPAEKLDRILRSHASLVLSNVNIFGVYLAEMKSLPTRVRDTLEAGERYYVDQLAAVIQDGIDAGDFEDVPPKLTALALLGMTNAAVRWYRRGRGVSPDAFGDLVSHLGAKALQAPLGQRQPKPSRSSSSVSS